jgi:hypothetical protein
LYAKWAYAAGKCVVCNYETSNTVKITYYLPDLEDEVPDEIYKAIEYQMIPGTISLPICEVIPDGYEFEGWAVNPYDYTTYLTTSNEIGKLWNPLSEYTISENVGFVARFKKINVDLYNDQFNSETLYTYDGRAAATVTLKGRTLYKDGNWNTLCLPFSLTEKQLEASPLAGGDICTLSSALFYNGTLTLNFTDKDEVKSITAGTPYIVKWGEGNKIDNPTFNDVRIEYTYHPVETNVITFQGNYSPVGVAEGGDKTMLYMGSGNVLYYPNALMTIYSFRAYFQLNNGLEGGETTDPVNGINNVVLNFGGEGTNSIENGILNIENEDGAWYDLSGRKLIGKPKAKGIYINNGRKFILK